jgi:catechol 2,3-dioxygenase-like lactoylglutathione lyase family enzyme
MAILGGIPVINCRSIETTLDFYQQLFQFVVVNKRELNGQLVWVHIMHGDTTLMLQSIEQNNSEAVYSQQSNISLYFFINNIKELHHFIKVKYNKVSSIKLTDYQMQEFSLLDPEGNTITLGQTAGKQS